MVRCNIYPADQQILIDDPVKKRHHGSHDQFCGRCPPFKVYRSVSMLWNAASIMVCSDRPLVFFPDFRFFQVLYVIAYSQHQLIRHKSLIHQIQYQLIRHLPDNQPRFPALIRTLQYLTGACAVCLRLICLYVRHGTRFPAPGMIHEQFRVDAKQLIEQLLIMVIRWLSQGTSGNIAHGV